MPLLSLDCLTLTDTAPADMIRAAGASGFDLVSLWLNPMTIYPKARVTPQNVAECERAMADTGVGLCTLEAFELTNAVDIRALRPAFELGARLGGKVALCYHHGSVDRSGAAELLALFAEVAAECGLGACIEPIAMGGTTTLPEAAELIRASGSSARILFDTWHLMRTGGDVATLASVDPALIGYVQINDGLIANGPKTPDEAMAEVAGERVYIGMGEFPLADLLRITPRGIPWGVETPSLSRAARGMSAEDQGREAMACMRGLLAQL